MTPNLNFEAESFDAFSGSHGETSQEYEDFRDRHAVVSSPRVRDHRIGGAMGSVRDHRAAGSFATVRDQRRGPAGLFHGRPQFGSSRPVIGPAWRGSTAVSRRTGFGLPGFIRGTSRFYPGAPTRSSWNRGWPGRRPYSYGARGPSFGRRWPWLFRDSAGGGMAAGFGSVDGGYPGGGYPGSGYPGGGYSAPDSSGSTGPGYDGSDYSSSDAGSGITPGRGTTGLSGSSAPAVDPETISWAQGCLSQIVGAWVPQDGKMGHLTGLAIEVFQGQSHLPSTGTLDDDTLTALHHTCQALNPTPTATGPTPPPGQTAAPVPNVVVPDTSAGQTPPAVGSTSAAPPAAPATPAPPATTSGPTPEMEYWTQEYEEFEDGGTAKTCEPDRCTSPYLRWLQNSLNQVFGQRLAITGTLDDPTMAAINRFRVAKKLKINESYHVGPAIEDALLAAGATPPPAVAPTRCAVSDPSKLIPILDKSRGDIPLEFLLGWIDVESAWVLEPPSVTCERGYFQLYPEDSTVLGLDHDRIGTDPAYSIQSGVPFIRRARKQIEKAVNAFGVTRNSDLYWHLVKLWHWIPSGPEKILASMSAQGVKATDWNSVRRFG